MKVNRLVLASTLLISLFYAQDVKKNSKEGAHAQHEKSKASKQDFTIKEAKINGNPRGIQGNTIHFGQIAKGDMASAKVEITITNNGQEALVISECKADCGCTTPDCPKTPIAPGQFSVDEVKKIIGLKMN